MWWQWNNWCGCSGLFFSGFLKVQKGWYWIPLYQYNTWLDPVKCLLTTLDLHPQRSLLRSDHEQQNPQATQSAHAGTIGYCVSGEHAWWRWIVTSFLRPLSSISTGWHYAKHQPSQLPVAMARGSLTNRRIFESHWFHQPEGIAVNKWGPGSNYTSLGSTLLSFLLWS